VKWDSTKRMSSCAPPATSCPTQGNVEQFVKYLRDESVKAWPQDEVRVNKALLLQAATADDGVYPDNVCTGASGVGLEGDLRVPHRDGKPVTRLISIRIKGANRSRVQVAPAPARVVVLLWIVRLRLASAQTAVLNS